MKEFHFSPRKNKAHMINWRTWGDEAFNEAQEQNKLILLSISAVWCHWCHVMDEEAYSDERNIKLINEGFIPIRVDTDRHPEINRRYNMGGWPTTAILTPEGDLLQGGTYIPGESLNSFLLEIDKIYHENSEEIKEKLQGFYQKPQSDFNEVKVSDLKEQMIQDIREEILGQYDQEYGGFGIEPKFPHSGVLNFLLDEYYRTRDQHLSKVLNTTLSNMANGGMYDREMGGFFRYSTTRDWSIPHFEKMLEDNANLMGVYLKAYQIFDKSEYKDVVLDIIMYLQDWLVDHERGLFYGSQDADEEYYARIRDEREKLKAPYVDKTVYINWNGLAISAFLRAYAVLNALESRDIALKGLDFLMKNCYQKGEGMYHYFLDGKGYNTRLLDDQMSTINALLDAYEVTGNKKYLKNARELADLVIKRFSDDGGFFIDLPDSEVLSRMNAKEKPLPINSCMAELYFRLEAFTGEQEYGHIALKTLQSIAGLYPQYGMFAAPFGSALAGYIYGRTQVNVVGNTNDWNVKKLFQEALKIYSPHKVVLQLDPIEDRSKILELGYNPEEPKVYICKGKQCFPPIQNFKKIADVLSEV